MSYDDLLVAGFGILIVMLGLMIAVGLPRGKRLQRTNERIAANQERILALQERQTAAVERIAAALENRR